MILLIVENVDKEIEINVKEMLLYVYRGCFLYDFYNGK